MKYKILGVFLALGLSSLHAGAFKDALEESSISGFTFGRFTGMGGEDAAGNRYQFRAKIDLTSGEISGYSLTGGIFFSQGSGTPDKGNNTDNEIQGSRGVHTDMSGSDVFNISNLYINKNFSVTKTSVKLGQMNIISPFTDKSLDRGIGGSIQNADIDGLKFYLQGYDSWMTDQLYVVAQTSGDGKGAGIGNNLLIAGIDGNYNLDEDGLHNLSFKLYDLWAHHLLDYMIFGELAYKYNFSEHVYIKLMGQIVATGVNKNAHFYSKSKYLDTYFSNKVESESIAGGSLQELAKTRGLYNLQASMEIHKFYFKVGFAGSFLDGYGAMLNNTGGFNTAGKLWNGSQGHSADGFGFLGSGATKDTNINAFYAQADYKIGSFVLALDGAYIGGKNNYPLLKAGSSVERKRQKLYRGYVSGYKDKYTMDTSFIEITPSIAYKIGKLTAQLYYAQILGVEKNPAKNLCLNRTRFQITYNF